MHREFHRRPHGAASLQNHKANRHIVVTDGNVGPLHGQKLLAVLRDVGLNAELIEFPAGEAAKNINTALDIVGQLLKLGADRIQC